MGVSRLDILMIFLFTRDKNIMEIKLTIVIMTLFDLESDRRMSEYEFEAKIIIISCTASVPNYLVQISWILLGISSRSDFILGNHDVPGNQKF